MKEITKNKENYHGLELAVIGISGKFPKSENIKEFWQNLKEGKECITFFTDEELIEAGIEKSVLENPTYVKANSFIEGKENFDFSFFQYTASEAKAMDPQVRLLHQSVWEALEDAGYNPYQYPGLIGLYASAGPNFKWEVFSNIGNQNGEVDDFSLRQLNDKDYIASRIAYKLNLRGPAVNINTACSSSLVAVHQACKSLLLGECDIAVAAGVSLSNSSKNGYLYREGMILSADGHCNALDENATGTVSGEGVGVVVLKRLKSAIADNDNILAVVKGSAVNNDGSRKVGFTAPGVEGQIEVLKKTLKMSKTEPQSIQYIETHGTGTSIGDAMELEALCQVYGESSTKYCGLGSVKTNVGHLDSAAGITGFIKTVLSLHNKTLPPSLNITSPHQKIRSGATPFYVNTELKPWVSDQFPLRAGVSSFGVGGTNAHVILEEAPKIQTTHVEEYNLLTFSGKTASALKENIERFKKHLTHPENNINLSDAAYTLATGRNGFGFRKSFVIKDVNELLSFSLQESKNYGNIKSNQAVVFMFPGQGAQYLSMGRELYERELLFRQMADQCFDFSKKYSGKEFKNIFLSQNPKDSLLLNSTDYTQPLLFIIEYSLATLLNAWGIRPSVMIGHSLGEYVAACLSGVFSLEDALRLVIVRGELMNKVEPGSMLSVVSSPENLSQYMNEEVNLAAVNTIDSCVLSGNTVAIEKLEAELKEKGIYCKKLLTSHAFHSYMMEPLLAEYRKELAKTVFNFPKIPFVSNLTGKLVNKEDVVKTNYWIEHLRNKVDFLAGLDQIFQFQNPIFIEVGPGKTLSSFVTRHALKQDKTIILNLLKHQNQQESEYKHFLEKIGALWCEGVEMNWSDFYGKARRKKVSIPTYAFDKYAFPTEYDLASIINKLSNNLSSYKENDISDCYYIPQWQQDILSPYNNLIANREKTVLVFGDENVITGFIEKLRQYVGKVIVVRGGDNYFKVNESSYVINAKEWGDYNQLFEDLIQSRNSFTNIVHLWNVLPKNNNPLDENYFDAAQVYGLYSLLNIGSALANQQISDKIKIDVVTNRLNKILDDEVVTVQSSTILGAIKVLPLEFLNLQCRNIDVDISSKGKKSDRVVFQLCYEVCSDSKQEIVGYRGKGRWIPFYKKIALNTEHSSEKKLKKHGVYLITGGLGGMGFSIAEHLAKSVKGKVILVGRSAFPDRSTWNNFLKNADEGDERVLKIRRIMEMEEAGGRVLLFSADVTDVERMQEIIRESEELFGEINGVIHTAAEIDYGGVILQRTKAITEKYMAAKVKGTMVLDNLFQEKLLDFMVVFSSIGNLLYHNKFGQLSYNAGNEFLEGYTSYKNETSNIPTKVINWCDWKEVGMTVNANQKRYAESNEKPDMDELLKEGLSSKEGVECFLRILESSLTHVTVYKKDLIAQLASMKRLLNENRSNMYNSYRSYQENYLIDRPEISSIYDEASNELEKKLVGLWKDLLGIKKIGIKDNFYDLGGDSLKAMILLSRTQKLLSIAVPLKMFLEEPTIECISKYVFITTEPVESVLKEEESEEFII